MSEKDKELAILQDLHDGLKAELKLQTKHLWVIKTTLTVMLVLEIVSIVITLRLF